MTNRRVYRLKPHPGGGGQEGTMFASWLDRAGYSARTTYVYSRRICQVEHWLVDHNRPPLHEADWTDLREYGETLPESYSSRSGYRSAVTAYWKMLERGDCPAWAIRQPRKPEWPFRGIPLDKMPDVLEASRAEGPRTHAAICLLYYPALRRAEAASLRWSHIVGDSARVVGKGHKEAIRELHPSCLAALADLPRRSPWVLPGRDPLTHVAPATINLWVRIVGARAGLSHLTPHQLRHTSVGIVNDTVGLREASYHARHSDVRTTMTYTYTSDEKKRAVLESLEPWTRENATTRAG